FTGNSLVLYTIGRNKRMRTRTNFFLANLAVADLAVGVLCVLPKLSTFLYLMWILGEAMCKIYYFVQSVTYTASVLLLTAVAVERYIAIIHPIRFRRLVTQSRLVASQVRSFHHESNDDDDDITNGSEQRLLETGALSTSAASDGSRCCSRQQQARNTRIPSIHHFSAGHRPGMCMWPAARLQRGSLTCELTAEGSSETTSTDEYDMQIPKANGGKSPIPKRVRVQYRVNSQRVLQSRKRVIRLLVVVLLTFAICVLPFHLKYVLLFWDIYPTLSSRMDVLSPLAFVMLYMNSALNPIVFWVFSDTFRRSLRDSFRRICIR
ncbi:hypothetical protein EGW08_009096, partial [Elysia chlorotica]